MDTSRVRCIEVEGIDYGDYPDFCDAFIVSAEWDDGRELSDREVEELNENHRDFVYECAFAAAIG